MENRFEGPPNPLHEHQPSPQEGIHWRLRLMSCSAPATVFEQGQDSIQVFDCGFQFADGVGGKFLGRRQFVGVFQAVVFEPFEAVEFEIAGFNIRDGE